MDLSLKMQKKESTVKEYRILLFADIASERMN